MSDGQRMVKCVKLGQELPALEEQPWPGPLGQRIYQQVSAEAWAQWEERMKMILERIPPDAVAKGRAGSDGPLHGEFFFGTVAVAPPPGYVQQPK